MNTNNANMVNCSIDDCKYHTCNGKCDAHEIWVEGDPHACTASDTLCQTFMQRG